MAQTAQIVFKGTRKYLIRHKKMSSSSRILIIKRKGFYSKLMQTIFLRLKKFSMDISKVDSNPPIPNGKHTQQKISS